MVNRRRRKPRLRRVKRICFSWIGLIADWFAGFVAYATGTWRYNSYQLGDFDDSDGLSTQEGHAFRDAVCPRSFGEMTLAVVLVPAFGNVVSLECFSRKWRF